MNSDCLLSFDENTRRVWMFPRNIRNIAPWKLHQYLKVLLQYNDQEAIDASTQQAMYSLLDEMGLKRKAETRDKNPGGMRTYFSQLECLGLIFKKQDGSFGLTLAGQAMCNGDNPLQVLQYLLLRHQYPSSYGLGQNVRIDPRMKVKPFLFILKLLNDTRLDCTLSDIDVQIPVIFGHTWDCYDFCVEKILQLRQTGEIIDVLDSPASDLYTPRGSSDCCKALANVKDIANTAMNYLMAADFVETNNQTTPRTYSFNQNYEQIFSDIFDAEWNKFIENPDSRESFQRSLGRNLNQKDTRKEEDTKAKKLSGAETIIQIKYIEYINSHPFLGDSISNFISSIQQYGFKSDSIADVIKPFQAKKDSLEETAYLEYANSGGTKSNEFEQATTNLLVELGFTKSAWIGRRKSQKNWRGNFPDVWIQPEGTRECGMADTKATSAYALGHADMLK
ncbi:MAG: hypothetical protein M0Q94_15400, partial [Candidatus Cloacimonetes bacterium]|nr:hypothetical protein [Candidatus Cloacimonadota bacterium]